MRIIGAYGCLVGESDVIEALRELGLSYARVTKQGVRVRHAGVVQPAMPVVVPSIGLALRYRCNYDPQIIFVCGAQSALKNTNVSGVLKPADTLTNVRMALLNATTNPLPAGWAFRSDEKSHDEYVKTATKPSFLNHMQTELYTINPYDLRRTVQHQLIAYLAGHETKARLMAKLNTSYKLDRLKALVVDPKCELLRQAVALFGKNQDAQLTANITGFQTFELLYIARSSAKTIEDAKK